ncbi:MAG: 2OG-Fe(II) oxygenase [Hyphomicrobiaceae bacterium]
MPTDRDELPELVVERLTCDLVEKGVAVVPGALPGDLVDALHEAALARDRAGEMREADIGRGAAEARARHIRVVRSAWLDGRSIAERRYLALSDRLRVALNRNLMLGLFELESQFLIYDPGGFYARHLDSFRGARNRIVSMVAYLNPQWSEEDGGGLHVWTRDAAPDDPPALVVRPDAGTLVLMMSEEIPHQVAPSRRQRVGIAGWWRVNQTTGKRVDPPR